MTTCAECQHFFLTGSLQGTHIGECRRHAPQPVYLPLQDVPTPEEIYRGQSLNELEEALALDYRQRSAAWPLVTHEDHCGEWAERNTGEGEITFTVI